jgi:hypothetical protein
MNTKPEGQMLTGPRAVRAGHFRQVRRRDNWRDDLALLIVPRRVHRDEAFLPVLEGGVF